jgi:YidC/Oxa1 family membrane protein insertase
VDRKTILAIVLSALVLLFVPKLLELAGLTPPRNARVASTPGQVAADSSAAARARAALPSDTLGVARPRASAFTSATSTPARQFTVSNALYDVRFDTQGARIVGVTLHKYKTALGAPVRLEGMPSVALDLGDENAKPVLADAVYETSDSTDAKGNVLLVRFQAADTAGMHVVQTYSLDPARYVIGLDVRMEGAVARGISKYHVELQSWPLVTERNAQEDANNLQAVTRVGNDVFRHRFNDLKRNVRTHAGAVAWTAVRSKISRWPWCPRAQAAKCRSPGCRRPRWPRQRRAGPLPRASRRRWSCRFRLPACRAGCSCTPGRTITGRWTRSDITSRTWSISDGAGSCRSRAPSCASSSSCIGSCPTTGS